MNNFLKYSLFIKIIFFLITTIIFFLTINDYPGKKYLFIFFTLTFSIFFLNSFNKQKIKFFEFFLSIFLWFGFFFKYYICTKIINVFPEGIGNFNFSPDSYDEVMLISSIGVWGLFFGYYFVPKRILKINLNLKYLENFYLTNSKSIIYLISLVIIIISVINFTFGIFQKGFVSNLLFGNIFRNLIAFLLMIGFGTVIAFIINFELNRQKYSIIYLSLFETFFTSFSSLSRAMIFNFFPFLVGYIVKINKNTIPKISFKKIFIFILILLFLFILSVIGTNEIRSTKNIFNTSLKSSENKNLITHAIYKNQNLNKFIKISNNEDLPDKNIKTKTKLYFKSFMNTISYRFIGIEGVMSVQSKKNKNFDLYLESFKEKYKENNVSFYDKFFLDKTSAYTLSISKIKNQHAITLPGFIAHSFYSGSYLFVFISAILVSIFCNILLIVVQNLFNNFIYTAFLANLLSYRLIHWGFAPLNSYKLLLGIFISFTTILLLNYAIKKIYFRK